MPRYLPDTNICIYIKNRRPHEAPARFSGLPLSKAAGPVTATLAA